MLFITTMNLSGVDLNLFLVLHAVLEERSATRAAKRLHVTQSAVSNALARVREVLGDPLVVRSGRGLVPTPRAEELAPQVAAAVAHLEQALDKGPGFAPELSTRTFTLAGADNNQAGEVPRVAEQFAKRLPRAQLRVVSSDFLAHSDGLATGAVDVAFMPQPAVQPGQHAEVLFEERGAMVVRRDHPRVRGKLTPALFNSLLHIDVQVAAGRPGVGNQVAAQHWRRAGLHRQVAMVVPHFTTAAMTAARTDWVAGLPSRTAELFCQLLPLKIAPTTFPMPSMATSLVWHPRTDADPGARYFRELILETLRTPRTGKR
jgi:DNA-binding transcriptional LysR family regulator